MVLAIIMTFALAAMPAMADEPTPYYMGCPRCGERIIVTKTHIGSDYTGSKDVCTINPNYNCESVINHYAYAEQCASGHILRTWTDTETTQDHSWHS